MTDELEESRRVSKGSASEKGTVKFRCARVGFTRRAKNRRLGSSPDKAGARSRKRSVMEGERCFRTSSNGSSGIGEKDRPPVCRGEIIKAPVEEIQKRGRQSRDTINCGGGRNPTA